MTLIIPALNEEVFLGKCLESIARQRASDPATIVETIVVDNQSSDGTVAVARRHGARVVSVAPGSPSRARNAGARDARGDWVAFVDADCELSPDWLAHCARHFDDPDVVAVGAAMRPPASEATWVERSWHQIAYSRRRTKPTAVHWLPGFNLVVRRSAFEAIGGFDERLSTCEDCDLGYRLADRGRLVFEPRTHVAHHGESRTLSQLFRREAWRSQGNLQLAFAQFDDWRNWISVLIPVVSLGGLVGMLAFGAMAASGNGPAKWGVLAGLVAFAAPFAVVARRVAATWSLRALPRTMVVLGVYLAARTAGLFFPAPRVARDS